MLVKQLPRILKRTKAFSLKSVVTNKFHTTSIVPEYGGGKAVTTALNHHEINTKK